MMLSQQHTQTCYNKHNKMPLHILLPVDACLDLAEHPLLQWNIIQNYYVITHLIIQAIFPVDTRGCNSADSFVTVGKSKAQSSFDHTSLIAAKVHSSKPAISVQ